MNDSTLHVAFAAPENLHATIESFIDGVLASPDQCHLEELEALVPPFVNVLLTTFFKGPIEASGASGSAARFILGAMNMIQRAADSLVSRLLKNTTQVEQQKLAEHFSTLRKYNKNNLFVAFPLEPSQAEKASLVFQMFLQGEGNMDQLLEVMQVINDGAIEHFMDRSVGCLSLGRINRALVSAARVTVCKASASATHKGLVAMDANARRAVVSYFDNMLIRFDDG